MFLAIAGLQTGVAAGAGYVMSNLAQACVETIATAVKLARTPTIIAAPPTCRTYLIKSVLGLITAGVATAPRAKPELMVGASHFDNPKYTFSNTIVKYVTTAYGKSEIIAVT